MAHKTELMSSLLLDSASSPSSASSRLQLPASSSSAVVSVPSPQISSTSQASSFSADDLVTFEETRTPPLKLLRERCNDKQWECLRRVVKGDHVVAIQGPPATGKSETLSSIVASCLYFRDRKYYEQINANLCGLDAVRLDDVSSVVKAARLSHKSPLLLVTPANNAVDELLLRVMRNQVTKCFSTRDNCRFIRVGKVSSISNDTRGIYIDNVLEQCIHSYQTTSVDREDAYKRVEKVISEMKDCENAEQHTQIAAEAIDHFAYVELLIELREAENNQPLQMRLLLQRADVVATTANSAGRDDLGDLMFDRVIIDEAAAVSI